jgi:ATP-dependent DNA helicase RecQ
MIENSTQNIDQALKRYFGFDQFKHLQKEIITSLLEENDVFVLMPTGGGKSLCYQLPALMSKGTLVVISPLIALMKNQVDIIKGISNVDGIAHVLNSSLNKAERKQVMEDVQNGITKLLFVAPESLNKEEYTTLLKNVEISYYAIDEAHCISEWGHDFRPEYRNLRRIIDAIGKRPIIALTATATPKVQSDIQKNLEIPNAITYRASFNRPNLYYEIRPKKDADKQLIKFIKDHQGKSGVIYCMSRKKVEEIAQLLQVNGIKAMPYHAGLDAKFRVKCQDDFLMQNIDVIIATVAFGMGIDKPDIRFVVHYEMPKSLENYYQETGRAGRDGKEGVCLSFYDYKDIERLEKLLNSKPLAEKEVGMQLLHDVVGYAETSMNRRKYLLNYFGEEFDEKNGPGANMDDNSQKPKTLIDVTKSALIILEFIQHHNHKSRLKEIVKNLLEKDLSNSIDFEIEDEKRFFTTLIRQLIIQGYLTKDISTYGELKISQRGEDFVKNNGSEEFKIAIDHDYEALGEEIETINQENINKSDVIDTVLSKQLYALRKTLSIKLKVPPFAVFQDQSLDDMANQYPINIQELSQIRGVGIGKAEKYGKPFVELINKYVQDNNIERINDLLVKQVINKSSNKVYIIQSIDRKMDLEDIASNKNWSMSELISEMESIVYQGTKLSIDYFLDELLEEEQQEEIFDYLMNAENDSISSMREEFGEEEYSKEELKLMRIKFLSAIAN